MNSHAIENAVELLKKLDEYQYDNVKKAAELIADAFEKGGILQAFGSGHSHAGALEIVERAGGFAATKMIQEPVKGGALERIEGVGTAIMSRVEVKPEDVVVIISYSGRNPLVVEVAQVAKERGARIIAITCLEISKNLTSRHSSGKMLYDFADVILDVMGVPGDTTIKVAEEIPPICPMSSIAAAALIQATLLETVKIMHAKGVVPDLRISANTDDGANVARSLELSKKYAHRVFRI